MVVVRPNPTNYKLNSGTVCCLSCVVRHSADKSCVVTQLTVAPHRAGPRMSLSKKRSSSVGNKARLAASHQSASGPVSSSSSSSVAVGRTLNTAAAPQHADKVFLTT